MDVRDVDHLVALDAEEDVRAPVLKLALDVDHLVQIHAMAVDLLVMAVQDADLDVVQAVLADVQQLVKQLVRANVVLVVLEQLVD